MATYTPGIYWFPSVTATASTSNYDLTPTTWDTTSSSTNSYTNTYTYSTTGGTSMSNMGPYYEKGWEKAYDYVDQKLARDAFHWAQQEELRREKEEARLETLRWDALPVEGKRLEFALEAAGLMEES